MARLTCNVVTLPRLCGPREAAAELTAGMPAMSGDDTAYLDTKVAVAVTQGFADELIRQILVEKDWGTLIVTGATPRLADRLMWSAHRRGVAARLVVQS